MLAHDAFGENYPAPTTRLPALPTPTPPIADEEEPPPLLFATLKGWVSGYLARSSQHRTRTGHALVHPNGDATPSRSLCWSRYGEPGKTRESPTTPPQCRCGSGHTRNPSSVVAMSASSRTCVPSLRSSIGPRRRSCGTTDSNVSPDCRFYNRRKSSYCTSSMRRCRLPHRVAARG